MDEQKKDVKVAETAEVVELKAEFTKIVNEINALNEQSTEKRTRLVEIQGILKYIESSVKKA